MRKNNFSIFYLIYF
uniref:Hypoxia-inducible factor 1-alpha inhibitor-like protein n=1 Tax=Triatoma infestans TaxID=30076 RepID=A0A170WDF7_TRIIF